MMKFLNHGRGALVALPFLLCVATSGSAWAQGAWFEPSLAPIPASIADFPTREGLKSLQPPKGVQGTLATLSHGILALRPLPESASNNFNGVLLAHFAPLTLGAKQRAYGPHITADGTAVIFRVSGEGGDFHLYKYQIKERTLTRLTATPLSYDQVEFSSDGHLAAVLRGVSKTGTPTAAGSGQLVVLDLGSGKETAVAKSDAAGWGGWAFLNPTTLVYSAMPANETFPALYTVPIQGGEPKLLAKKAWRPLPSVDGAGLAFFGAENPDKADDALRLSEKWNENPRGAYVSIVGSDGANRKALWRQDGAYPLLQWSDADLLTLKNRRWISDLGEHRIDKYDAARIDDYKGGLFGTLNLDGAWKWIALLKNGSIADYQVYQVYPTTTVDYEFSGLGQSGDSKMDYFSSRITSSADGDKITDALWIRQGPREFRNVTEFEGSDGLDFHDETGPNAKPTGIKAYIDAHPQGEAIAAANYTADQATIDKNVDAGIVKLKAALPDAAATRKATYAVLEAGAGAPIGTPPAQEDAWVWLEKRTGELFPQTDKAQATKNSLLLTGEALHVAETLLASGDAKKRQMGFDLARSLAETRIGFGQKDALRGLLLGWIYPNIELAKVNSQLVPVLNNLVRGTQLEPGIYIPVLQLQLVGSNGAPVDDTRLRLATALIEAKRLDEAKAMLALIADPAFADRVAQQKAALLAAGAA